MKKSILTSCILFAPCPKQRPFAVALVVHKGSLESVSVGVHKAALAFHAALVKFALIMTAYVSVSLCLTQRTQIPCMRGHARPCFFLPHLLPALNVHGHADVLPHPRVRYKRLVVTPTEETAAQHDALPFLSFQISIFRIRLGHDRVRYCFWCGGVR